MNASSLNQLKQLTGTIEGEDKIIAECMLLVIAALEFGPDPTKLSQKTGLALTFVEEAAARMQKANLWFAGHVDDEEWDSPDDGAMSYGIFKHALVAAGITTRVATETGAIYRNSSGEVDEVWERPTERLTQLRSTSEA